MVCLYCHQIVDETILLIKKINYKVTRKKVYFDVSHKYRHLAYCINRHACMLQNTSGQNFGDKIFIIKHIFNVEQKLMITKTIYQRPKKKKSIGSYFKKMTKVSKN